MSTSPPRRLAAPLAFLALLALTLASVAIPVWLIRPFVAQTPGGVETAFWLRRLAPAFTAAALIAGVALTAWRWRAARWWGRALLVAGVLVLAAGAWASRFNVYEKMFAPLPATTSVPAAAASWVQPGDMVLAVTLGCEAAAYPVRQVAYHHVVHDLVGGVPIVVTY